LFHQSQFFAETDNRSDPGPAHTIFEKLGWLVISREHCAVAIVENATVKININIYFTKRNISSII